MPYKFLITAAVFSCVLSVSANAETLRLAHVQDPADPVQKAAEIFRDSLAEQSDGNIEVQIFPSASLGKYQEVQDSIQRGSVDILIESIGTLSRYAPVAGIESMPYLFERQDDYLDVWTSDIGQELKEIIAEKSNFRVTGHMYRGARQLTANRPIESIDDLQGLKMRVSPMRERLVTWETFGASPTPMAWSEVFTALQQGVIEAQENPLATIQSASLNEVQDYLIMTSHMANGFTFILNDESYQSWSDQKRNAVDSAAAKAADWYNEYIRKQKDEILSNLKDKGMEVIEIDKQPFMEKSEKVVAEFPDLEEWYAKIKNR